MELQESLKDSGLPSAVRKRRQKMLSEHYSLLDRGVALWVRHRPQSDSTSFSAVILGRFVLSGTASRALAAWFALFVLWSVIGSGIGLSVLGLVTPPRIKVRLPSPTRNTPRPALVGS